jgi:hypothetical protein
MDPTAQTGLMVPMELTALQAQLAPQEQTA